MKQIPPIKKHQWYRGPLAGWYGGVCDKNGQDVLDPKDPQATQWCLGSWINKHLSNKQMQYFYKTCPVRKVIKECYGFSYKDQVGEWNNLPSTTVGKVNRVLKIINQKHMHKANAAS